MDNEVATNAFTALHPTVQVAIVGIISALVSGAISFFIARRQFHGEIKKILLERDHKLSDAYLESARKQIKSVYMPLSASVSRLRSAFGDYIYSNRDPDVLLEFEKEVDKFIAANKRIADTGNTIFLTEDIDKTISSFLSFLYASKASSAPVEELVFDFRGRVPLGLRIRSDIGFGKRVTRRFTKRSSFVELDPWHFDLGILKVFSRTELVMAPFNSTEFQARFDHDTVMLTSHIKVVTLGASSHNGN